MSEYDKARFRWLGKRNKFTKGTGPWLRTEIARKMSGKTVGELIAKTRASTPFTLVGRRLIEIEGYQGRATDEEVETLRNALRDIVEEQQPMTVRQVFYQATVHGLVEKEETGYDKVQRMLVKMRREDQLPFEWIVDNTRQEDRPYTCVSIAETLQETADQYSKTLWTNKDPCVQILLEKDALAGVISPITRKYDVSLMVARGYSSITFLKDGAEKLPHDRPSFIYHLGDFDSSGVDAGRKIEEDLNNFAPDARHTFYAACRNPEQIDEWDLPTRPTKTRDSRAASFGSDVSVELDAIEPRRLRTLVEKAILRHMPKKKYDVLMKQERKEKERIQELGDQMQSEIGEE